MHSSFNDPLLSKPHSPVSLKPLFVKQRHFETLNMLEAKYLKRRGHRQRFCRAIEQIRLLMVADWQVLLVHCRYLESTGSYLEMFPREIVTSQLIHLLFVHDTVLSYLESTLDAIELQQFETDYLGLVDTLYDRSKSDVKPWKIAPTLNSQRQRDRWREVCSLVDNGVCDTISINDWTVARAKDFLDPSAVVIECDGVVIADVTDAGLASRRTQLPDV